MSWGARPRSGKGQISGYTSSRVADGPYQLAESRFKPGHFRVESVRQEHVRLGHRASSGQITLGSDWVRLTVKYQTWKCIILTLMHNEFLTGLSAAQNSWLTGVM
jgi:hypothetical protein